MFHILLANSIPPLWFPYRCMTNYNFLNMFAVYLFFQSYDMQKIFIFSISIFLCDFCNSF